ncbi:LLM class flavin-dependent oxidoreductase [Cellulomonas chengniuliangii]|uniref:LLM class flavin-dependent oxidoreductase n=1 Tax=Cellulomonas chengniuliangii TaxID=2968084 RepID=A0ABY5KVY7_9CELL|nr:LLM class flavin-dependent oxidoreductase [Cellulomonas chengniuliangii]MCC2308649.1 LLM class flavin-dependent oxidoreductase [Cellulomonas chengniuliangii]UUI74008.1 LLM class flavin-dependent oxidoreductase [Cellulomonas chengniuliangii]
MHPSPGTARPRTTLGAVALPSLPPERLRAVARAADAAGLEELWLWEDCFLSGGVSTASALLASTDRLAVGIGVMPVPLRNVALAAMEVATLERMFPGRLRVGVGHGVQDWMGQVGARVDSPLTLLREHVTALRSLLAGSEVTTDGRYVRLRQVRLDWPPERPPLVGVGTGGPRSLRLSGEVADATILTGGTTPAQVARARELIDEGRAAAGRQDPHPITVYLMAATGPGATERLEREQRAWGHEPGPEGGAAGSAEEIAAAVGRWADAGADTVVLQPLTGEPDPEGFVRFVAEEVRPLTP